MNMGCDKCKWYHGRYIGMGFYEECTNKKNIDHGGYKDFMPELEVLNKNRQCVHFELKAAKKRWFNK